LFKIAIIFDAKKENNRYQHNITKLNYSKGYANQQHGQDNNQNLIYQAVEQYSHSKQPDSMLCPGGIAIYIGNA
jgi:hypothetical protein